MSESFAALLTEYKAETWSIDAKWLEIFIDSLERHDPKGFIVESESNEKKRTFIDRGGVAVIPIEGILLKTAPSILRDWGFDVTGYDEIKDMLETALESSLIKSILLDIDSPGGQVAGGLDTANLIAVANKHKPVNAEIRNVGASSAYFLASQASKIKATTNSKIGSMGVYVTYYDFSKMAENDGVKAVVIRSGKYKGMGAMGDPITKEQISVTQEVIDGLANNFIKIVAKGRDLPIVRIRELATGQLWLAAEAKDLGLIDGIIKIDKIENNKIRSKIMSENAEMLTEAQLSEAAEKAAGSERERITLITKELAGDGLESVRDKAIAEGLSLSEAKALAFEALQKSSADKFSEQQKELDNTKARLQAIADGQEGLQAQPDGEAETQKLSGDDGKAETYVAAKNSFEAQGKTKAESVRLASDAYPESHAAWVKTCPESTGKPLG